MKHDWKIGFANTEEIRRDNPCRPLSDKAPVNPSPRIKAQKEYPCTELIEKKFLGQLASSLGPGWLKGLRP